MILHHLQSFWLLSDAIFLCDGTTLTIYFIIVKGLVESDEEWEKDTRDSSYCSEDGYESDCVQNSLGHRMMKILKNICLQAAHLWMNNMFTETNTKFGIKSFYSKTRKTFILQYCTPRMQWIPFFKRSCNSSENCFTTFIAQNLLEVIRKWTNV